MKSARSASTSSLKSNSPPEMWATSSRASERKEVKVGDTLTAKERPCSTAVKGFEDVKPMVFAGIYPVDTEDYEELRASMEKPN